MPYLNGKKVSNAEWLAAKAGPVDWKEATGYNDGQDPVAEAPATEEPKPKRRRGTKKADAEDALKAITGLDINLGDEEENDTND